MSYVMPGATVQSYLGIEPRLGRAVFVAAGARLIGNLEVGEESSIWYNTVVRADVHYIRIGARTNVQDNSTLHVTSDVAPCVIGSDVTIGHNAIVHACTVEDLCLIGMGAVILDKALIRRGSVVGAGALVTQGKEFPPNSLIIGSPAKAVRTLTEEERRGLEESARHYIETARQYIAASRK